MNISSKTIRDFFAGSSKRAIVCKREPIAARALTVTIVRLERPPHAPAIVLQKTCALAAPRLAPRLATRLATRLASTFAGRLVHVGVWAM